MDSQVVVGVFVLFALGLSRINCLSDEQQANAITTTPSSMGLK